MRPVRPLLVGLASCLGLAASAASRAIPLMEPDGSVEVSGGSVSARWTGEAIAFTVEGRATTWSLASVGGLAPEAPVDVVAPDGRLERRRGDVVEWYLSTPAGIEQGFDVASPPEGSDATLVIEQRVGSGARVEDGGRAAVVLGDDGRPALRVTSLVVRDALDRSLPASFETDGAMLRIVVDVSEASWPIEVDPLIAGPEWVIEGEQQGDLLGRSVAGVGDVDGDGLPEMVVGLRGHDGVAGADCGAARLYRGSATGLASTPTWQVEGTSAAALFGAAVARAGDVDDDGFDDLLVAEHGTFVVHAFLGSASGLDAAPSWTATSTQSDGLFGAAITGVGDVDGDGFDDVAVGEPLWDGAAGHDVGRVVFYRGGTHGLATVAAWTLEGSQAYERFGEAIAGRGDVDGDGLDDVVVGAPKHDTSVDDAGRIALHLGSSSGPSPLPSWQAFGDQPGAFFGTSIAVTCDLQRDGFADIVVGVPGWDAFEGDEGRVLAFLGSADLAMTGPSGQWVGAPRDALGTSVAGAGDVDGDGHDDVVVGAPGHDDWAGRVVLLCSGGPMLLHQRPLVELLGSSPRGEMGVCVAGLGDVDGDGFADFAAGAWMWDGAAGGRVGRACVSFGHRAPLEDAPSWSLDVPFFVGAVSHAGDLDADGYGDLVVESPVSDEVHVFRGGAHGPGRRPWAILRDEGIGGSVARAGDVNGDGYDDVLVGGHGELAAKARLFLGGPSLGVATWSYEIVEAQANARVTGAGDVNGDGFADVIVTDIYATGRGAQHVFLGSRSGLPDRPSQSLVNGVEARGVGQSIDAVGDVDADGYDDVVVAGWDRVFLLRGGPGGVAFASWSLPTPSRPVVSHAGDVNADGFSDVIVGHPGESRAALYLGGPMGLGASAAWTRTAGPFDRLGWVVTGGGDLDGDGHDDVVIGDDRVQRRLHIFLGTATGLASEAVVLLPPTASGTLSLEGDLDGDGFADLVTRENSGVHAYLGTGGGAHRVVIRDARGALCLRGATTAGTQVRAGLVDGSWRNARLEWRTGSAILGGEPGPVQVGPWRARGEALEEALGLSGAPGRSFCQVRVRTRWPFPQVTRWLTLPGNGAREADVLVRANAAPTCGISMDEVNVGGRAAFLLRATWTDVDGDEVATRWNVDDCASGVIDDPTAAETLLRIEACATTCTVRLDVSDGQASRACVHAVPWRLISAWAGPDHAITCASPSVLLNASIVAPAGSSVTWSPAAGLSDAHALAPAAHAPGAYTLTVRDPLTGCEASDVVFVWDQRGDAFARATVDGVLTCSRTEAILSVEALAGHDVAVSWSPASAVSSPTSAITTTSIGGTYVARVTDLASGCIVEFDVVVEDRASQEPSDLVARPGAEPLTVRRDPTGNLVLRWEDAADVEWSVFSAPLAELWSTRRLAPRSSGQCQLDVPVAVIAMPPDDSCYLVATDCGGGRTSTLGFDSLGVERPSPSPGCP